VLLTTVIKTPLLATPLTVTTTLPVVAPVGTAVTIDVALQLETDAATPLNVTVLVPWVAPKLTPLMVTDVPTVAEFGETLAIFGIVSTVKDTPLLLNPFAVTITLPVVAPLGTVATIDVALQLATIAAKPLKLTEPDPCVAPKFDPLIVTELPTTPEVGERLLMLGPCRTVNDTPLLLTPLAWTTTLPVVAAVGTVATIDVALQLAIAAVVPLNVTEPEPWVAPKFDPLIVTAAPAPPDTGEILLMLGVPRIVNETALLQTPLAYTAMPLCGPCVGDPNTPGTVNTIEVVLQLVYPIWNPLSEIVPADAPKPVPVIVTVAPTAAPVGDTLATTGVGSTVNDTPLLGTPLALTMTLPVVAPVGTVTVIEVALQFETSADTPLNVTEPEPCVEPKFVPVIPIVALTASEVEDRLVMLGAGSTVNATPLLAFPPTVTTTFPEVVPAGMMATIAVELQLTIEVTVVVLNFTVLDPCEEPKFNPLIVTAAPMAADDGATLLMLGNTVKSTPLLLTPLAYTTTLPVVAPVGTVTLIDVAAQLVTVAGVPLKLTVPVPCVEPKLVPVMVTAVPTAPDVGDNFVMLGAATTVNFTPLLATPLVLTTTLPVVAPVGTVATIEVALQLVIVAFVPLNVTVLVPWVALKPEPAMVTDAPTAPVDGDRVVMVGVGRTVNDTPLLATPLALTTTLPVVAVGTVATIEVALQLVIVAFVPLNVTVPVPCVDPKAVPLIVTDAPTAADDGERLVISGAGRTLNDTPLLYTPLANTTTFPVVAPLGTVTLIEVAAQLVIDAATPLNVTVPFVEVKLVPVIVTAAPTAAEVGDKLVILGAATTVKVFELLAVPPTVTTTLPVVAPVGTMATMEVALQLVMLVTVVVLNLTVLVPCVEPKFVPVIVTDAPTAPLVGERLVMLGAAASRLAGNIMLRSRKKAIRHEIRVTMHLTADTFEDLLFNCFTFTASLRDVDLGRGYSKGAGQGILHGDRLGSQRARRRQALAARVVGVGLQHFAV